MKKHFGIAATCLVATLACGTGAAQDLGKLGGMIPGASGLSSGSMSNVAGLLQYCVQNNYLGGATGASGIQDQLLGKLGTSSGSTTDAGATDTASSGSATSDILNKLTGKNPTSAATGATGADPASDPAYLNGTKGILQADSGQTTDLASLGGGSSDLKSQLTKQVCDTVLKQGKSFLGM